MDAKSDQVPPCETFNKKKALACYKLRFNWTTHAMDHVELYRVTNETPNEYYVLPIETLQRSVNRHLSYHKSGAFHWRDFDGKRITPRDGESDARRAALISQGMSYLSRNLDGYCISKGRDVSDTSLAVMLEILDGYIIPPLGKMRVADVLKKQKATVLPLWPSQLQVTAAQMLAEDEKNGTFKRMTVEEMQAAFQKFAPNAKTFIAPPVQKYYCTGSRETMLKLCKLARTLVAEKMADKPNGFWIP